MALLINLIRRLSLPAVQGLGGALGTLTYWCSPTYRRHLRENLRIAGYSDKELEVAARREIGQQILESAWLWGRPIGSVEGLVSVEPEVEALVSGLLERNHPIVFLTPHIGNFELLPRWFAWRFLQGTGKHIAVMYRRPKQPWLDRLITGGRQHGNVRMVPADLSGVRQLARSLRAGEFAGILPDQVPRKGEGVWAPFFGKWAYTVSLPARLAKSSGAAVICVWAQRLPQAKGWRICGIPPIEGFTGDPAEDAALMNSAIESVIRRCPEQYLWGYNRYKRTGSMPPIPSRQQ